MSDERPDPDASCAAPEKRGRGRLKVFFGASPGVGKTYAMLEDARRQARRGRRRRHRLGRDARPRRRPPRSSRASSGCRPARVEYRGVELLRVRPRRRARAAGRRCSCSTSSPTPTRPGARHAKRWQDARGAARRGHRRLHDAQRPAPGEPQRPRRRAITGVAVRETVPDRVLDEADEVEFVDLPPEELLKRLARGQGLRARAGAARPSAASSAAGNLLALRELALRRTAEHVDADVRDYRRDHEIERDLAGRGADPRLRPARTPRAAASSARARRMAARLQRGVDRGLRGEPVPAGALGGRARRPLAGTRSSSRRSWGRDTAVALRRERGRRRCSPSRASAT